jgi:excisionase family DNA binding protein
VSAQLQNDALMTAKEVAAYLKLAVNTVYTLPIPCYRFGTSVRYDFKDVEEYKQSCRSARKAVDTVSNLTALLSVNESALQSYFQKAGHKSKRTNTTNEKQQGSMRLRLVNKKNR